MKHTWHTLFFITFTLWANAQAPQTVFTFEEYDAVYYEQFGNNKRIPDKIRPQVLTALSFYPELKNTRIVFRLKKRKTPLTSRPRISSAFLPKGIRSYVITLSTETESFLAPILFSELPYNAQIGVLGHEIAHIAEYKTKTSFQLIGLGFKIGNPQFEDRFEFNTDKRAIEHGLGHQLLDWSRFVRTALNIVEWKGASINLDEGNKPEAQERYMNPETIQNYIAQYSIYSVR